jgi:ABC-type transporter Mla subunit MlaD
MARSVQFDSGQLKLLAARVAAAILLATSIAACSASTTGYTTELDTTGGLTSGSSVTHGGTTIGSVTATSSKINGDYDVDFDVENQFTGDIHHDSIVVLHSEGGSPSLDVYNADPTSPQAAPGAKLTGVSSQRELAAVLASKSISSLATGLSGVSGALSAGAPGSTPPLSGQSVLDQFQRDLATLQNQASNSGPATAATAGQLNSITQQTRALEQELIKQGNSPQAAQLRDALNRLTRSLANPPAPPPAAPTP